MEILRGQRSSSYKTIGDVHLGDWGLQMGLIIEELRDRKPELPYFDAASETLLHTLKFLAELHLSARLL